MKLICTQENFNKAIFTTQGCITKNINLPILGNILLQTNEGRLKLSATNLEIGITCLIGAKIEKEGTITIPAKTLSSFVSKIKPQKIELETKNDILNIKSKEAKTNIKGVDAKDFPIIPNINEKPILNLKVKDLKLALSQVISAAASSETRPELTGIYTKISFKNPQQLTFAATDSYRLAEKVINLSGGVKDTEGFADKEELSFIIPKNTLNQLVRILDEESDDIKISVIPSQISFDYNNTNLISRLIDGQYPDYKQIIPQGFKTKAVVNTSELMNAIKIASIFTEERSSTIKVSLNVKDSVLDISAESGSGDSFAQVKAKIEGQSEQVVFNYKYFLDGLDNILKENTVMEINSSTAPVVLKGVGDDSYTYIIMPIKL